jgi:hypothetical protein
LKNSRTHFNFRFGLIEQLWAMKGLNQLDWNKKIRWNKKSYQNVLLLILLSSSFFGCIWLSSVCIV